MVKSIKQLTSLAISLAIMISLFGCGGNGKTASTSSAEKSTSEATTQAPTEKQVEPVTLTWFGSVSAKDITTGIQDNPVMNEIKKKTGITIDFTPNLNATDIPAKLAIMLSANELPDIITYGDGTSKSKILNAKVAIPLDELVNTNGKDIQKNASKAITLSKLLRSDNTGALYFIPGGVGGTDFSALQCDNAWVVRWDLYKKLGQPKLETTDDYLTVLKKMMELEPTNKDGKKNYGLGLFFGESWASWLIDKPYANYRGDVIAANYPTYLDMKDDKLYSRLTDPNSEYMGALKFYNKAYQMGVLDPESATLKFQTYYEKAQTGRYVGGYGIGWTGGADNVFITDKTPEKGYIALLFGNNKDNIYVGTSLESGNQYGTCITKSCKTPDRAMDLLNFLCTPEGAMLNWFGVEGVNWIIKDGKPYITPEEFKKSLDVDYSKKTGVRLMWMGQIIDARNSTVQDPRGFNINIEFSPEYIQNKITDVQKDYLATTGYKTVTEAFTKVPRYLFDNSIYTSLAPDIGSDLETKNTKLGAYVESASAKIIFQKTDADFEKEKAKFIETCKAMGADELVKFYQDKYEASKAKLAELSK